MACKLLNLDWSLLNAINHRKLESKIVDLQDENGLSAGTRVEILIPVQ